MEGKENIQPVINFIDSMEDNYEKKQKNMKEKIGNNEKWLKEWTKRKNIFNKCFYDEANEKVESVMQEINEKECTEAEIDEMIERIDCFINTKNDIPSNVNFKMGRLAVFVGIISAMLSALLSHLMQHIDKITEHMSEITKHKDEITKYMNEVPKYMLGITEHTDGITEYMNKINEYMDIVNIAVFLLGIVIFFIIIVPVIFGISAFFHYLYMSKKAQFLMYRWETLNLLKTRLNKLKKEKFGQ